MEIILIIPLLIAFLVTLFTLPYWIKKTKSIGLVWNDMNKYLKPRIAGSGGVIFIIGFILSVLSYIFIKTFYFNTNENVDKIFTILLSILILAITGLIDDLFGWQHGGLSKKVRIIMCIFASIPLIVINVGDAVVRIPFIGTVNLGVLYTLAIIPLAIVGASTTFNFLAGFNGLESSQGVIILTGLSVIAYFKGNFWLSFIGFCMVFALLAFYLFNKYPAMIFPGDVLTYPLGGMIAIMAILGNMEKVALFFFIPYIIETILKLRGRLEKYSFGKPNKDDSLELPYEKFYGLEHIAIYILKKIKKDGKVYEREVVGLINLFQIVIVAIGFAFFWWGVFNVI